MGGLFIWCISACVYVYLKYKMLNRENEIIYCHTCFRYRPDTLCWFLFPSSPLPYQRFRHCAKDALSAIYMQSSLNHVFCLVSRPYLLRVTVLLHRRVVFSSTTARRPPIRGGFSPTCRAKEAATRTTNGGRWKKRRNMQSNTLR